MMGVCRSRTKRRVRGIARKDSGSSPRGTGEGIDAKGALAVSIATPALDVSVAQTDTMLQAISDSVLDAVVVVDARGRVQYWNRAAERMFGYSGEEILGRDAHLVLAPRRYDAVIARVFARFAKTGEAPQIGKTLELQARRKDGTVFPIELSVSAFRMRGQWCAAAIVRDVTSRKKAERQLHEYALTLKDRTAELTRSNRRLGREVKKRREAHEALRREQQHLRRLLELHDHERRLISFEIHDGLAQDLAGAIMYLASARSALDLGEAEATKLFDHGLTLLRQSHEEARRLISGLRPPILDDCGLAIAIEELIAKGRGLDGPRVEFVNRLGEARLSPLLEQTVFRVVQEGLTNACRYSESRRVRIELLPFSDGGARLIIRDWGKGFDPRHVRRGACGLEGIKERIRLLGGQVDIHSVPGKGTRIVAELPPA
jgi:PAS domain S-box-containing protein